MPFDFNAHLRPTSRTVTMLEREGKLARGVTLERAYDTTTDDLWDAVTNPERLPRWFLPVSGELTLGSRYQLEGNAGGTITECVPPRSFAATWEFGAATSWIEVHITPEGNARSRLSLCHICPVDEHWEKYGPGAAGVGWDLGLFGLAVHLSDSGSKRFDEGALMSAEGKAVIASMSEDWGRAAIAAGENPAKAESAAKVTTAFYTGEESQEG